PVRGADRPGLHQAVAGAERFDLGAPPGRRGFVPGKRLRDAARPDDPDAEADRGGGGPHPGTGAGDERVAVHVRSEHNRRGGRLGAAATHPAIAPTMCAIGIGTSRAAEQFTKTVPPVTSSNVIFAANANPTA